MGRIRSAFPHRRSRMTARIGSFFLKVESGAEQVVARALRRLRTRKPAPEPAEAEARETERGAEARQAEAREAEAREAEAREAEAREAAAPARRVASNPPAVPAPSPPLGASAPATAAERANPELELPQSYGRSRVVVLAIDPHHVHAYWEVTPADAAAARARLAGTELGPATWVLRFHDVTRVEADTASAHGHFDVDIDLDSRNWYIDLWASDKTYLVELGARVSGGFAGVCRSAPVVVPAAQLSPAREPEWRTADPEHATTHAVPESDPRMPRMTRSAADAPAPATHFADEQPWVAATRGEGSEGAELATAGEAPPTSKAPATRGATPHALALEARSQPGAPAPSAGDAGESSRSVSLAGVTTGSGGSFTRTQARDRAEKPSA